ncbi:MAG: Coenzyme F420 hydrogenase/dehydrogenase, beta subunit C-terminal domain [Anaerostipes sp.]|nr:Coenzyme F420 hydrogenase/dehydrogenase, beta subunit C-terminal domain [Anaerostipes sp.]
MSKIILFNDKKDCCGCGACMNVCPKQAITMEKDEYSFIYPVIDEEKCVECEMCKKVCGYQKNPETISNINTWVAVNKNESELKKSASGGIFAGIAKAFIEDGGVVFGCAMVLENNILTPKHIMVDSVKDLYKLQGSKYVQSYMENNYQLVKEMLKAHKKVLFSGTPCQVAGLNAFLGGKQYDDLFTIDIICHGVPSADFFQAYIEELNKKNNGNVTSFLFRDKDNGWGLTASVTYTDTTGNNTKKLLSAWKSSYYSLFLSSKTYRINCYSCPFAGLNRPGNITIGDFWGIEKQHPEYLNGSVAKVDETKGVSCILVNNEQGTKLIETYNKNLQLLKSDVKSAAKDNGQLNVPSPYSKDREMILNMYKNKKYEAIDKWYRKSIGPKYPLKLLKDSIPKPVKKAVKKMLGK